MPNHDIAREIHRLPHHLLLTALPDLRATDVFHELRTEFARWTVSQPEQFGSWRQAWNRWTRASAHRPGAVTLTVLCPECRGRLFSSKRGIPGPCITCHGRRRATVRSRAIWQADTEPAAP